MFLNFKFDNRWNLLAERKFATLHLGKRKFKPPTTKGWQIIIKKYQYYMSPKIMYIFVKMSRTLQIQQGWRCSS